MQRLISLNVCDYPNAAALSVALNDLYLRIPDMNPDGKARLLRAALTEKRGAPTLLATVAGTWDPSLSYEVLAFGICSVITAHFLLPKAKEPPLNLNVRSERRPAQGNNATLWCSYHKSTKHNTDDCRAKPPGWSDPSEPPRRDSRGSRGRPPRDARGHRWRPAAANAVSTDAAAAAEVNFDSDSASDDDGTQACT